MAGHMVVERDEIDPARGQPRQPRLAVGRMLDLVPARLQRPRHKPRETGIVVDIEDQGGVAVRQGQGFSGTWMTAKKRPSWRMALAKPS